MHELGVTKTLLLTAEKECVKRGLSGKIRVKVTIGALTTYKEQAISSYFEALKKGILKDATLKVGVEQGAIQCRSCGMVSLVKDPYMMFCPSCDSPETEIIKGRDVVLNSLEKS